MNAANHPTSLPPPLLTGAALLFWGWQTGFLLMGALLAVLAEGARVTRAQWDLNEEDFNRLWNLTALFFIAAAVLSFTLNDGPEAMGRLLDEQALAATRAAGETSQRTAASLIQWFPMIFALFLLAHTLSRRGPLPLAVFSLLARKARRAGEAQALADRTVNVGWAYFALCLVSASINTNEGPGFYAGTALLLAWALAVKRSRRYRLITWAAVVGLAGGAGYLAQAELTSLRRFFENWTPQVTWRPTARRTSPDHVYTSLGQIGRIKDSGRIVMRVEPKEGTPVPGLLRTASYRYYRSPAWAAGNFRSELGERVPTGAVQPESGGINYVLRPAVPLGRVGITTPLARGADLLPLPAGVARLENLVAYTLKTNILGAAIIDGPGVVVFDAVFHPTGSFDGPPTEADLHIPERELPAVDQALAELKPPPGQAAVQTLRAVNAWFQDHFTYRTWQPSGVGGGAEVTPLQWFLAPTNRAGHCEYFATATTLLLRRLGLPTRYAVGWAVSEAARRDYVVRERHAHAWCLVYYNGQWHDFDTTPASWLEAENRRASPLQVLSDAWTWVKFEFLKWRWGQSSLRRYIWWIIGPMLLFLLYRLLRRRPRSRPRYVDPLEDELVRLGLDSEFYQLEKRLRQFGFVRQPAETLAEFVERAVRDPRLGVLAGALRGLLRLHYQLRFDPHGLDGSRRRELRAGVRAALEQIAAQPAVGGGAARLTSP